MGILNKIIGKTAPTPELTIENISIQRLLSQCKKAKIDTLFITTSRSCPLCGPCNRKVYSLYGWNRKYPQLPPLAYKRQCPKCGNFIGATMYFPGISSPIK